MNPTLNTARVAVELGERIARYRIARNLTQKDLAAEAGVDRTTIVRLEKGKGTLDTLIRVMSALAIEKRLLDLVPGTAINPLDHLQKAGKQRKRVRKTTEADDQPWSWAEDS